MILKIETEQGAVYRDKIQRIEVNEFRPKDELVARQGEIALPISETWLFDGTREHNYRASLMKECGAMMHIEFQVGYLMNDSGKTIHSYR